MNLNKIAEGLRLIADGLEDGSDKKADTKVKPTVQKEPVPEKVAEKEEPTTAEPAEITKEQVIQALQLVAKANGRAGVDKILADFNVDKVSALAESDYADAIRVAEAAVK